MRRSSDLVECGKLNPDAVVVYEYSKSGQITARTANGVRQTYEYDKKGQLLAVKDADGKDIECYAYDRASNMVRKTLAGKTTTFTFDAANQLVSSTCDGVTTRYEYDAAGRMIKEGDKTYTYGYLDKVMSVRDGANTYTYAYHPDGQLASANYGDQSESFAWDGLALIRRGDEQFVNDPHVGGGNPVASSKGTTYFNDILGTTVGAKSGATYTAAALSAFGEDLNHHTPTPTSNSHSFYTGKPAVEGIGYAFLMRNYRASLAKWQTADPMGYPENAQQKLCFGGKPRAQRSARRARKGPRWNQLAYCNNAATSAVDLWGCKEIVLLGEVDHSGHHVATVWAECNHNYNKPEFTIHVGQLKDHPDNKYVKASVDGTTNIPATPNFSYVTTYAYTDADITHQVTLENFELVVNKAVPVDELFNKIIVWEYQVEFDVKDEWEEYSALKKMTRVEKQEKVSGRHIIEE